MEVDYKILVAVGTTPWDSLINYIDKNLSNLGDFTYQIGNGKYTPNRGTYFRHKENFIDYCKSNFDVVITHGGAGNIYGLLEVNMKIIVIPNLERVDGHQLEIAKFVQNEKYGEVVYHLETLSEAIHKSKLGCYNKYSKDDFNMIREIIEFIK